VSGDFDEMFQQRGKRWVERTSEPRPALAEGEELAGTGPYKPYGYVPTDDLETCDIVWWLPGQVAQGHVIQYRFLIRIAYIGEEDLHLFLTDSVVRIEGQRLFDLRKRLSRRRITFIQCFNPLVWPEQPPAEEPVISRISVLYPGEERGRQ
jgi:hypothetical protein